MNKLNVAVLFGYALTPVAAVADGFDEFAKSLGAGDAHQMAISGVFGHTADRLKDPRSMQIVQAATKKTQAYLVGCLEYRSKNSFAAYVPGYSVWKLGVTKQGKPQLTFKTDDAAFWNAMCVGNGFRDGTELMRAVFEKMKNKL